MIKLPIALLDALNGTAGFDREAFVNAHEESSAVVAIRANPLKIEDAGNAAVVEKALLERPDFKIAGRVPWCRHGYYLQRRPSFTFDPLFHAGCYYVQDASSMFLEQAFKQLTSPELPLRVLDLCAAPGGKSTLIQSLLPAESLLVSNEVIRSRANILTDNIIKWGGSNVMVSNNDPSAFRQLEGYFDVMVVDAPCSGSGLFRKDAEAIGEWSPNNVALCYQRQQRILSDALPCLKEGGLLVYATCSYSREEDEDIADWLVSSWDLQPLQLNLDREWGIVETKSPKQGAFGYRFYPYNVKGEGFFLSAFRNNHSRSDHKRRNARLERPTAKEIAVLSQSVQPVESLIRDGDLFFALPRQLQEDYAYLKNYLNILYKGVAVGRIMKEKLVPEHALALSTIVAPQVPANELSLTDAILFLQKQEMHARPAGSGWQLVTFKNNNLGWVNVLPNRVNNYYPKELRILKRDPNDSEK